MDIQPLTLSSAMARGFVCRCPNCGKGRMFQSFLKAIPNCTYCGEILDQHRADDLPAYIIILVTGHLLVPLVAFIEIRYGLSYWQHAALWIPVALIMSIGLLQPVKGAIIALQWFNGMHGFAAAKTRRLEKIAQNDAE